MKPTALHPAISLRIICGMLFVLASVLAPPHIFAQPGVVGGHVGVATPGAARPVGPGVARPIGPGVARPGVFGPGVARPGVFGVPRDPVMPFRNSVAPFGFRRLPPGRWRRYPIHPVVGFFPGFYGLGYSAFWISGCDGFWGWGYGCGAGTIWPYLSYAPDSDVLPDGNPLAETFPADNFDVDSGLDVGSGVEGQLPQTVLLYLKDGSVFAVTRYSVSDGKLHYLTAYGAQNDIDLNLLDLQKTVDENAASGVTFTLTPPNPGSTNPGSASPGSASPGSASPGSASPGSASPGSVNPGP
jgi:hypothetical protein